MSLKDEQSSSNEDPSVSQAESSKPNHVPIGEKSAGVMLLLQNQRSLLMSLQEKILLVLMLLL